MVTSLVITILSPCVPFQKHIWSGGQDQREGWGKGEETEKEVSKREGEEEEGSVGERVASQPISRRTGSLCATRSC